jgi:hypothetical protein
MGFAPLTSAVLLKLSFAPEIKRGTFLNYCHWEKRQLDSLETRKQRKASWLITALEQLNEVFNYWIISLL